MTREYAVLLGVSIASYAVALLVSYVLVRWVLPEGQTRDTNRYLAIDGIRGFLAFGVFIHHSVVTWLYLQSGTWGPPPTNFANQLGRGSVAIFFMITAFLFWGRVLETKRAMDWKQFFVSRFFRIYPLYILAFLIVGLAVGYKSHWTLNESPRRIIVETFQWLVFRQPDINQIPSTALVMAAVSWTLQYELWFYLALPLLCFAILLKNPVWKQLACLLAVYALFALNRLNPSTAAAFLGGILAVYWTREPRLRKLAQGKIAASGALACFCGVFFLLRDSYHALPLILLTIFFIVVASGNTLFGILSMRAALWMGEISYSIYLLHGIILWIVLQNVAPSLPVLHRSPQAFALTTFALATVVILVSSVSLLLIERPFIALGKQALKRPRRLSAAA
jgi:peptidoglycan/LPS O-acetylase OafA/YrhL